MQSKYGLEIFPKAAQDMENIFAYISEELKNLSAARNLIDNFHEKMESVRSCPKSCAKINNVAVKNKELRKAMVKNYIIFYNINEKHQTIEIIRVLYGMMNYQDIL